MSAEICEVVDVRKHPNADRLSIMSLDNGKQCLSANLEDGSSRYRAGQRVLFISEGSVVPEWLLRKGFWDDEKGKGLLGGDSGDVVTPKKIRGELTEGILFAVDKYDGYDPEESFVLTEMFIEEDGFKFVPGLDVTVLLGIR